MDTSWKKDQRQRLASYLQVVKNRLHHQVNPLSYDREVWVKQAICNYLSALHLELTERPADTLGRNLTDLRRSSLAAVSWARRRQVTADDILEPLQGIPEMSPELLALIREDVGQLLTRKRPPYVE